MINLVLSVGLATILASIAIVFLVCAFGFFMDILKEHHLLDHERWFGGRHHD